MAQLLKSKFTSSLEQIKYYFKYKIILAVIGGSVIGLLGPVQSVSAATTLHITAHGTWSRGTNGTFGYFTSNNIAWGYHGDPPYGHVHVIVSWHLSEHEPNGGMYMNASLYNSGKMDDVVLHGSYKDGAPGVSRGGSTISSCKEQTWTGIYAPGTDVSVNNWCFKFDKRAYDHNMDIGFSWQRPGRAPRWFVSVRSIVAHSSDPGKVLYRLRDLKPGESLAGANGTWETQDHMTYGAFTIE